MAPHFIQGNSNVTAREGIHSQFYSFQREFSTTDIMILWEAFWTEIPGPNFHLFCGLAILEQHKSTVMENRFGLSEILRVSHNSSSNS